VKFDPEIVSIANNLATIFLLWRGMSYLFQYLMKRLDKHEVDVYGPRLSSRDALVATGRTTRPPEGSIS